MRRGLLSTLAVLPAVIVGGAIAVSPDLAGDWVYVLGQRLLYVHVPLAWVAYLGFALALGAAILVLTKPSASAGRTMRASVEVTTIFAATALLSGLAWSYEFLFDPLADPKVLTTIVLVAVLAGLWTLASSTPPPRRDRLVASVTLVGFAAVPASYAASWLITPHPDFARPEESMSSEVWALLLAATLGFTILHLVLTHIRTRVLAIQEAR